MTKPFANEVDASPAGRQRRGRGLLEGLSPQSFPDILSIAVYFAIAVGVMYVYAQCVTRDDPNLFDYGSIIGDGRITVIAPDWAIFRNYANVAQALFLFNVLFCATLAVVVAQLAKYVHGDARTSIFWGVSAEILFLSTHTLLIYDHILLMKAIILVLLWASGELWLRQQGDDIKASLPSLLGVAVCTVLTALTYQVSIVFPLSLIILMQLRQPDFDGSVPFLVKFAILMVATTILFAVFLLFAKSGLYAMAFGSGLRPRANISLDVWSLLKPLSYWEAFRRRLLSLTHPVFSRGTILVTLSICISYFLVYRRWRDGRKRLLIAGGVALLLGLAFNPILAGDFMTRRSDDEVNMGILVVMTGYCGLLATPSDPDASGYSFRWQDHVLFACVVAVLILGLRKVVGAGVGNIVLETPTQLLLCAFAVCVYAMVSRKLISVPEFAVAAILCSTILGLQFSLNRVSAFARLNEIDDYFVSRLYEELELSQIKTGNHYSTVKLEYIREPKHPYYSVLRSYSGASYVSDALLGMGKFKVVIDRSGKCAQLANKDQVISIVAEDKSTALVCFNDRLP